MEGVVNHRSLQAGVRAGREAMAARQRVCIFFCIAMSAFLAACSGNNNLTLQNPSAPAAATAASIAFSPTPVTSINLVGTAQFTAVVKNDPSEAGVDWALLCQGGTNCGALQPSHTASGKAATYKPPANISGNSQTVTIEAFASANHDSNVAASLAVTGFDSNLKGTYVFATQGEDAFSVGPYQISGVVVLDGNGKITSGEQTFCDTFLSVSDAITGGSYYLGPDGRGTLTINTADQNIGQQGIENLALVFISSSKALIQTLDNPNLSASNELSSGTLESQTSKSAPNGGYAFVVNGYDSGSLPLGMGGIFNIDSASSISGKGSLIDIDDLANGGTLESGALSGTLTRPDAFGSVKLNLTTAAITPAQSFQFTGYIVDATHIKLVESDINGSGGGFGATSGLAVGQGSATGAFTSNSAFAGTYVFEIVGEDPLQAPLSLASDGQFTADASGNLNSGYDDEALAADGFALSDSFTGSYTLDASGTGRVDTGQSINFAVNGPGPELIFYLTGNGNPPLVLDADNNSATTSPSVGMGAAYPPAAPPFTFNGRYGLSFDEVTSLSQGTATGQVIANQSAGTLANGAVDTNQGQQFAFEPTPDTTLTGTFGSIPRSGRFTGTLSNTFFAAITSNVISVAFYPVNPNLIFFIETDFNTTLQSTFGSFQTRTPVCSTCP